MEPLIAPIKKCRYHGYLSISETYRNGASLRCRHCNREARKKYHNENKEKANIASREYYKKNKKKIMAQRKAKRNKKRKI
jgi:hypothetical protein